MINVIRSYIDDTVNLMVFEHDSVHLPIDSGKIWLMMFFTVCSARKSSIFTTA